MSTPVHPRRRDTMRHLLRPYHLRESAKIAAQPSLRNSSLVGIQASLAVAIALPAVELSPWPHLIGFAALGTLVALFGRFAPAGGRGRILLLCALCQIGAVFVVSALSCLGVPLYGLLAALALLCGIFFFIATSGQFGPPGALIFVFAAGAAMGPVASWWDVFERTLATTVVSALAWLICMLTERFREHTPKDAPFPSEPARPFGHRLNASARITLGAAVAAAVSYALGTAHPAWAVMGTMAVMQGSHLHISMNRALQRMAGAIVGAGFVWLVLIQQPSVWVIIALLVVLQFITELIIGSNYALGQMLVTPMALLMSYLAAPGVAGASMAPERVLDTVIGATLGIVLAVVCSTVDDRLHLAHHHAARDSR